MAEWCNLTYLCERGPRVACLLATSPLLTGWLVSQWNETEMINYRAFVLISVSPIWLDHAAPLFFIPQHKALDAWSTGRVRQTVTYGFHFRKTFLAKSSSGRYQLSVLPEDYRANESIQPVMLLNISCSNLRRHNDHPGSGFLHFLQANFTEIRPSLYGIIYGLDDLEFDTH